jgi:hypothetical protein
VVDATANSRDDPIYTCIEDAGFNPILDLVGDEFIEVISHSKTTS